MCHCIFFGINPRVSKHHAFRLYHVTPPSADNPSWADTSQADTPHADLPEMATEAGSTHPTGMHSCLKCYLI